MSTRNVTDDSNASTIGTPSVYIYNNDIFVNFEIVLSIKWSSIISPPLHFFGGVNEISLNILKTTSGH